MRTTLRLTSKDRSPFQGTRCERDFVEGHSLYVVCVGEQTNRLISGHHLKWPKGGLLCCLKDSHKEHLNLGKT